jgi:hypothetical protein
LLRRSTRKSDCAKSALLKLTEDAPVKKYTIAPPFAPRKTGKPIRRLVVMMVDRLVVDIYIR